MSYPSDLNPTLKTDWANNTLVEDTHPNEHNYVASAVDALKAKVGANGSAVTTSHDYKLGEVTGSDKAVGKTATQTLSGKTLTTPKIVDTGSINDTDDNEFIKFSKTANAVNEVNITNSATGNSPIVGVSGDDSNIDLSLKAKGTGNVKFGTANIKLPNTDGTSGQVLQTNGSGVLSFSSPSQSIPFYISTTNQRFYQTTGALYSDVYAIYSDSSTTTFALDYPNTYQQNRVTTSDWASVDAVKSAVILGIYIYVLVRDVSNNYRVYRYSVTDLSTGGTLMTLSGQTLSTTGGNDVLMTSNGADFFFNYKAGNSANSYVVSRYTLSGTTLTYSSDITCGSTADSVRGIAVDSNSNIFGWSSSDSLIRKYNSSGTLQYTTAEYRAGGRRCIANFLGNMFLGYRIDGGGGPTSSQYERIYLS